MDAALLATMKATDATITKVKAAFGAPGDYGYGTAKGDALLALYGAWVELGAAIAKAEGA